tara:strand:- start:353 stop:598 length:246 start_codon:yes stop_codon:yes gene_type:complete
MANTPLTRRTVTDGNAAAPAKVATLADIADNLLAPPALPGHSVSGEQYLYFTERDIKRILDNLDGLRNMVFPLGEPLDEGE